MVGRPLPRKDIPIKINGTAVFGLDMTLPGMLHAVVECNPRFRGKVKRMDSEATLSIPSVKRVFTVQQAVFGDLYEGVAVVADNIWAAMKGRKALKVKWDDEGFEHLDSELLLSRMREGRPEPADGCGIGKNLRQSDVPRRRDTLAFRRSIRLQR
jgi:isoquinoline 1-oxidoreductase beta subunit